MLPFQRIIAFSSRVHSYLLVLLIFFVVIYAFTLTVPTVMVLVDIVNFFLTVISWTMVFEGIWIICASLCQSISSKVLALSPLLLTLLRLAACLSLSFGVSLAEELITKGFAI